MRERVLHFLKALITFAILFPTAVAATLSAADMNGLDSAYAQAPQKKIIKDDATGGDCISIGSWNRITETCTLTTDLPDTSIQIDSDRITLDGNGHTITGNEGIAGIILVGRTDVTVKNLMITNFDVGILLREYSDGNTLSDNTIIRQPEGYGIYGLGYNNILRHNTVNSNGEIGIFLVGSDNTVTRNTVNSNGNKGIFLVGSDNTVTRNTVNSNGDRGILLDGSSNTVIRNTVKYNGAIGIALGGNTSAVIHNTVNSNGAHGITCYFRSDDNILAMNTAHLNRGFGYFDESFGSGTAGTASIYLTNKCLDNVSGGSNPTGLCSPRR
jgi:parallel beta-helix repeat protein